MSDSPLPATDALLLALAELSVKGSGNLLLLQRLAKSFLVF